MTDAARVPVAVADSERLHRVVADPQNVRGSKPHYMAFYSKTEPARISVDRAEYRSLAQTLAGERPEASVAALLTADARGLAIVPPLRVESCPENDNDAHAEIRANDEHSKNFIKTKVCAMLADVSSMVPRPSPA
jgi:hypothetical protein